MTFEEEHAAFIRYHLDNRTGERRGRLDRGHRYGESLFLRNVWWPLRGGFEDLHRALLAEKEIIRLAIRLAKPIRPKDVVHHFEIDQKTAVLMLKKLCTKGWLLPLVRVNGERIVRYELARGVLNYFD